MVLVHTCIFSLLLEAINISPEKLVVRKMHLLNVCMKEERIYALFFFIYRIGHVSNPRGINQNREREGII